MRKPIDRGEIVVRTALWAMNAILIAVMVGVVFLFDWVGIEATYGFVAGSFFWHFAHRALTGKWYDP